MPLINHLTPTSSTNISMDCSNPKNQDIWFDAIDHVEMEDTWFDTHEEHHADPSSSAGEAADSRVPFTEDCRRSVQQFVRTLGEYGESKMLSVCLSKILPGTPTSLVIAANSLYTAITEQRNIDAATVHALGLASWYLPDNINVVSQLATFIRDTVTGWTDETFLQQFLGNEGNHTSIHLFTALAVTAIVAGRWMKNEGAPQRGILKVPTFMANIFIRASHYWTALGNMASSLPSGVEMQENTGLSRRVPAFEVDTQVEITGGVCDVAVPCSSSVPQLTAFSSNSTANPEAYTRAIVQSRQAAPGKDYPLSAPEQMHYLSVDKLRLESGLSDLLYCGTWKTETRSQTNGEVVTTTNFNTKCDATVYPEPLIKAAESTLVYSDIPEAISQSGGGALLSPEQRAVTILRTSSFSEDIRPNNGPLSSAPPASVIDKVIAPSGSRNLVHPASGGNIFSTMLRQVANALYETGQFISRYDDPLKFTGVDASALPTDSRPRLREGDVHNGLTSYSQKIPAAIFEYAVNKNPNNVEIDIKPHLNDLPLAVSVPEILTTDTAENNNTVQLNRGYNNNITASKYTPPPLTRKISNNKAIRQKRSSLSPSEQAIKDAEGKLMEKIEKGLAVRFQYDSLLYKVIRHSAGKVMINHAYDYINLEQASTLLCMEVLSSSEALLKEFGIYTNKASDIEDLSTLRVVSYSYLRNTQGDSVLSDKVNNSLSSQKVISVSFLLGKLSHIFSGGNIDNALSDMSAHLGVTGFYLQKVIRDFEGTKSFDYLSAGFYELKNHLLYPEDYIQLPSKDIGKVISSIGPGLIKKLDLIKENNYIISEDELYNLLTQLLHDIYESSITHRERIVNNTMHPQSVEEKQKNNELVTKYTNLNSEKLKQKLSSVFSNNDFPVISPKKWIEDEVSKVLTTHNSTLGVNDSIDGEISSRIKSSPQDKINKHHKVTPIDIACGKDRYLLASLSGGAMEATILYPEELRPLTNALSELDLYTKAENELDSILNSEIIIGEQSKFMEGLIIARLTQVAYDFDKRDDELLWSNQEIEKNIKGFLDGENEACMVRLTNGAILNGVVAIQSNLGVLIISLFDENVIQLSIEKNIIPDTEFNRDIVLNYIPIKYSLAGKEKILSSSDSVTGDFKKNMDLINHSTNSKALSESLVKARINSLREDYNSLIFTTSEKNLYMSLEVVNSILGLISASTRTALFSGLFSRMALVATTSTQDELVKKLKEDASFKKLVESTSLCLIGTFVSKSELLKALTTKEFRSLVDAITLIVIDAFLAANQ